MSFISIKVTDDEGAGELLSLRTWLASDEDLREVPVSLASAPLGPEDMGTLPDAIQVATDSSDVIAAALGAVTTWLGTRRRRLKVRVRRGKNEIEIEADRQKDVEGLLRDLLNDSE